MTLLYPACPAQHRHASRNTRMLGIVCMLSQLVWIRPQGRSDAFTGCGGNAIAFARMPGCAAVYACDMDRHRLECVRCASQASSHCPFACLSLRACPRQFAPPLPSLRHVHASMPLPSPPTRGPEGPASCQTQRRGVRRAAQDPLHAGRFLPAGAPPSPPRPWLV